MPQVEEVRLDRVFNALSNPVRRQIVHRLKAGEASVSEIVVPFSISQPAISRHLRVLEDAGLIVRSKCAQKTMCKMSPRPLKEVSDWVDNFREYWETKLERLDTYLAQIEQETK